MESLLSLSFDNISSRNTAKTSKGLRQIEGLLAQICLAPRSSPSSLSSKSASPPASQRLQVLSEDLAFQEFFRLQESFEWNVATRLTECLERLLGMRSSPQLDDLIRATLTLLQGALLLHPPSRILFSRENHMNLLLDLLDPAHVSHQTLAATLMVLLTTLLDHPGNARLFENLDGVNTVASLWKSQRSQSTAPSKPQQAVDMLCREFLAFYLLPEEASSDAASTPDASPINTMDMPPPSAFPVPPLHPPCPQHHMSGSKHLSVSGSTISSKSSAVSAASGVSLSSNSSGGSRASSKSASSVRTAEEKRKLLTGCLDAETERALATLKSTWTCDGGVRL